MGLDPAFLLPEWLAPPGVRAISTLRTAGVSHPPWDSLNLGMHVGDDPGAVQANRRRLREAAALPAEPHWLEQVHGIAVADLDAPVPGPRADAAVSSRPGQVCVVMTADCLPVVLASSDGAVVGVAHAGWRGLAAGVVEATVDALRGKMAAGTALQAWLAPAIGAGHFEVGEDVRAAFLAADGRAAPAFTRNAQGRWQCDLYLLARQRLHGAGVERISGGGHCTYAEEARFFSHRRDVQHRGLDATGRMATLVWRT
ncbi:MAG: peptidoglycan editing factor PgeF [Rhodanobacteraceae bacterium]|nr:peptidoglycan editing factor PgeF [Rhodanobacteraceae bacterium]